MNEDQNTRISKLETQVRDLLYINRVAASTIIDLERRINRLESKQRVNRWPAETAS